MEEKEVIRYYHPALRKKAQSVVLNEETKELIKEMKEILRKEDGVGLAAPQVGESKKVIVINSGKSMFALLNPEIVKTYKERTITKEGCLSIPGVWLDVVRPRKIRVRALNEEGEALEIEAEDSLAVVLQHEIDHLKGVLFWDRVNPFLKIKTITSYYLGRIFKRSS